MRDLVVWAAVGMHVLTWLTLLQDQPVTSQCDQDVVSLCLRNQGLETLQIGQVKQCLVNLGVPEDPYIQLAAEVTAVLMQAVSV